MSIFRALDVDWPAAPGDELVERLLAEIDDCRPTALEPRDRGVRLFFASDDNRARAAGLTRAFDAAATVAALDVPDEGWAERSQAQIEPIRVGRFILTPPWHLDAAGRMAAGEAEAIVLVIQPSMGFGTGHHASTRLCLRLLQGEQLAGASLLDIGTGSGVLAIAAVALGAGRVTAIDMDADALAAARENVDRNGTAEAITLRAVEIGRDAAEDLDRFDVVTANLTGALLERHAPAIASWTRASGTLIASGYQSEEAESVTTALRHAGFALVEQIGEDEWVGGRFQRSS